MNTNNKKWYVGAMNDGLFVIDAPPRPSTDDITEQSVNVIAALGTNREAADLLVAEHNKRVETIRTIEQNRADIRQRALSRDHVIDLVIAKLVG